MANILSFFKKGKPNVGKVDLGNHSDFDAVRAIQQGLEESEKRLREQENFMIGLNGSLRNLDESSANRAVGYAAAQSAKSIQLSRANKDFDRKYEPLKYKEIEHQIRSMMCGLPVEDPILSKGELERLSKSLNVSCVMSDFLLPFYLEKETCGILSDNERKELDKIYDRLPDGDQITMLGFVSAIIILNHFGKDYEEIKEYFPISYGNYVDYKCGQQSRGNRGR